MKILKTIILNIGIFTINKESNRYCNVLKFYLITGILTEMLFAHDMGESSICQTFGKSEENFYSFKVKTHFFHIMESQL